MTAMRSKTAALALLFGCASAPPPEKPREEPAAKSPIGSDDLCTVHCERAEVCGVHRDACERDCPARGRSVDKMRFDFVGRMLLCLDGASCAALKEGSAWRGCHEGMLKTLPVTDALRRFCFASSRRAARCGRAADADQSACLTKFRYQSDEALTASLTCLEKACDEVPACMARELTR